MARRSRHRRPKYARMPRALLAIGATGAGLVLPLVAATGANAAPAGTSDTVSHCETGSDWSTDPDNRADSPSTNDHRSPDDYSAPVKAAPSTPYRAAGPMWTKGYHTGVDFPVPTGTPVKAVADGCVVSAGWAGSYGNQVVIKHNDGEYSEYAHLSRITVQAGDDVKAGQEIGLSGSTGNVSGPHLHFEVRTTPDYGSDIDPVEYLRHHGIHV